MTITTSVQSAEQTYYQGDGVTITNSRAIMGGKTYVMANITSVAMQQIAADTSGSVNLAIVGVVVLVVSSIFSSTLIGIIGFAIIVFAIYLFLNSKPEFAVAISAASGEQKALQSPDRATIEKIVAALNEAIIHRG